ncbi:MAG: polyphosphate kinase 2 family protein [Chloroflexi bacterium]|nr:polyphosphate kinase 2 family protein [Chloroflexota bacterium]
MPTFNPVKPGEKIDLSKFDPADSSFFEEGKKEGKKQLAKLTEKLEILQELFYAHGKHRLLIVLQAMDAGGKDGVIRHVFEGVNPQGVSVANFKVPTPEELSHDYLWRIHKQTPAAGEIVIFNRSHYEDVLVVRVKNMVDKQVWSRRFDQINHFEKMLSEEGTIILKFFLHISKDEQKQRLQDRLDDPSKHWKFNPGDLKDRALWQDYMHAYGDVLSRTSTAWAPWYIIPSDRKWLRSLIIADILVKTLEGLNMTLPDRTEELSHITIE